MPDDAPFGLTLLSVGIDDPNNAMTADTAIDVRPVSSLPIFLDGFESGNTTAWSLTHPESSLYPPEADLALVLWDLGDLPAARAMALKAMETAALQPEGSAVRVQVEAAMDRRGFMKGRP